jgi:hypothetical protein
MRVFFSSEKCEVAKSEDVILFYANPKKIRVRHPK